MVVNLADLYTNPAGNGDDMARIHHGNFEKTKALLEKSRAWVLVSVPEDPYAQVDVISDVWRLSRLEQVGFEQVLREVMDDILRANNAPDDEEEPA